VWSKEREYHCIADVSRSDTSSELGSYDQLLAELYASDAFDSYAQHNLDEYDYNDYDYDSNSDLSEHSDHSYESESRSADNAQGDSAASDT
jgi:hypothetical protein